MSLSKHNGIDMGPNPPKHMGSPNVKANQPKGKDAGGTANLKAAEKHLQAAPFHAPESGSDKFKPANVRSHGGISAPHAAAKSPASKTKSPQNNT